MNTLKRDAWAGITVGLVLVPQSLAYATLAGMPPEAGLYAAFLPAIAGILWGSSALLAVGPVALTSLLTFGSLSPFAIPKSAEWITLAIWLAFYAGLVQLLLGTLRLGRIASLVSQPVITGFINAAAIIIILSQLPDLFGVRAFLPKNISWSGATLTALPWSTILLTSTFGCGAIAVLTGLRRRFPRFPGMLLISVLGLVISWAVDYVAYGGVIIGSIPAGLPSLTYLPVISIQRHMDLLPAALTIGLVSFTEAMSSARALARAQRMPWDENQELIGQGLAKIVSGFCGGFPVSGSFSRSALNLYAGAVSAWSTLFAALCVLLSLMFLTSFLYYLPQTVLAAMIIVPVCGLIDVSAMKRLFFVSRDDGIVASVTFAVTVLSTPRLHWGVFAGVALSMLFYLYRRMQPRIIEVSQHHDGTLRDRKRFDLPALADDLLAVRMDSALSFVTAASLQRFITDHCRGNQRIRRVLLCAGSINAIDATGIDVLETLHSTLCVEGIEMNVSAVKKQVWDVMEKAGTTSIIGKERLFATDADALSVLRRRESA